MKLRRLIAVLAVGAFIMTGAACSKDSKDDKAKGGDKSEQTKGSDEGGDSADSSDSSDDATPSTVTDDEFSKQIGELSSKIEAAGTDVCELMNAAQANPPQPANEAQTKEFVEVWTQLLKSIGGALGSDDQKALEKAADDFAKMIADKGYSPDIFSDDEVSNFLSSEELSGAMDRFGEKAMECIGGDAGADGADGAGSGGADAGGGEDSAGSAG